MGGPDSSQIPKASSPSPAADSGAADAVGSPDRVRVAGLLAVATFLAMSAWFSTTAAGPALAADRGYSDTQLTWMVVAVQAGFVFGTLLVALLNLPDIMRPQNVYFVGAVGASVAALSILVVEAAGAVIATRFLLGLSLAAVYPVGMKLLAGWYRRGRGLVLGIMIGALTLGSGLPHLLRSLFTETWEPTIIGAALATLAGGLIVLLLVPEGPFSAPSAPFRPRYALEVVRDRPTALAIGGYLGHMWELYAMWTWVPLFLAGIVGTREVAWNTVSLAGVISFAVFAAGAAGCVVAGVASERWGRSLSASAAMVVSGSMALVVGFLPEGASVLIVVLVLVWGLTVVADSGQFSAAMSELADPRYVGSALTIQTGLGFLLTIASIRILPVVQEAVGWGPAFAMLAVGPALGTLAMLRLRQLPEAAKMASGRR